MKSKIKAIHNCTFLNCNEIANSCCSRILVWCGVPAVKGIVGTHTCCRFVQWICCWHNKILWTCRSNQREMMLLNYNFYRLRRWIVVEANHGNWFGEKPWSKINPFKITKKTTIEFNLKNVGSPIFLWPIFMLIRDAEVLMHTRSYVDLSPVHIAQTLVSARNFIDFDSNNHNNHSLKLSCYSKCIGMCICATVIVAHG